MPTGKDKIVRGIFDLLAGLLLIFMFLGSKEAGISGDEDLHYQQSVAVYNYFATQGADQSALHTPATHLQYYGQSFDNLTTILIRWFSIDDIYTFRHQANALAGWLCILLAAQLAIWLSGYGAGILTLLLFALSPTFLGHAQNNLKDIPFALAYLAGTLFLLRWLFAEKRSWRTSLPLLLSIGFCISIRPGGVLLACYLLLFAAVMGVKTYRETAQINRGALRKMALSIGIILVGSYFAGILLWPYVLQNPISGFWKSYQVMTQFPTTIRQIFEGRLEWSDWMPWYYLPKLMLITIPLIVWAGIVAFFTLAGRLPKQERLKYAILVFTILFPIVFVIYEKSNLYGSWRHFLFVYPAMVVLAAIGMCHLWLRLKTGLLRGLAFTVVLLLAWHPFSFLVRNTPYYYLYYNQLAGGLKGAYGNYETDYYYHSMREGSEWLTGYLKSNHPGDSLKVGTNFPADWFYRNDRNLKARYIPWNERNQHDWDYFVVTNSYISPALLKNKNWPPKNAVKIIEADGVPICAVVKRETKADFLAYRAYRQHQPEEAVKYFEEALQKECQDEIIFFNFASVCYSLGDEAKAMSLLQKGLEINPECDRILMFRANILAGKGESEEAVKVYKALIGINRKYFDAYPALAKILVDKKQLKEARDLLKRCLTMNPGYKAAYAGLAESYRTTDPDVARKYDELAK
jgi:predicted Zn-dependent protease